MLIINSHIVPKGIKNIRLSEYARDIFIEQIPSRKGIKKAIKRGAVFINKKKAYTGDWIETGQLIHLMDLQTKPIKVFPLQLEMIFEDDYLCLIKKPAGIPVSGNFFKTIQNALPYNLKPSSKSDALKSPRPVHRLDSPTSGLLLIAKTTKTLIGLSQQFEKRQIQKTYHALVIGRTANHGLIENDIDHKEAITRFNLVECVPSLKNQSLSLLEVFPKTGRTHQIRKHLSEIGFPILGDKNYGKEGLVLKKKGLFLSATSLQFVHPLSNKTMNIQIDVPYKFKRRMTKEKQRWEKYNL